MTQPLYIENASDLDTAYVWLRPAGTVEVVRTRAIEGTNALINVDFDAEGGIVGVEIIR